MIYDVEISRVRVYNLAIEADDEEIAECKTRGYPNGKVYNGVNEYKYGEYIGNIKLKNVFIYIKKGSKLWKLDKN